MVLWQKFQFYNFYFYNLLGEDSVAAFFAQASQSNANSVAVTSSAVGMLHHPPGLPLISAQVNPVQTVQPPMNALQVIFTKFFFKIWYDLIFVNLFHFLLCRIFYQHLGSFQSNLWKDIKKCLPYPYKHRQPATWNPT